MQRAPDVAVSCGQLARRVERHSYSSAGQHRGWQISFQSAGRSRSTLAAAGSFLTASSSCSRRLRRRRRWSGRCRSVRIIWLEHFLQYVMHAHGHALCQDSVSGAFVDPELKHLRSSLNSYIEGAHDNLEKFLEDLQTVTSTLAQDEQYR